MLAQIVDLVEDGLVQMAQEKVVRGSFIDGHRKAEHLRIVDQVAVGGLQFEQRGPIEQVHAEAEVDDRSNDGGPSCIGLALHFLLDEAPSPNRVVFPEVDAITKPIVFVVAGSQVRCAAIQDALDGSCVRTMETKHPTGQPLIHSLAAVGFGQFAALRDQSALDVFVARPFRVFSRVRLQRDKPLLDCGVIQGGANKSSVHDSELGIPGYSMPICPLNGARSLPGSQCLDHELVYCLLKQRQKKTAYSAFAVGRQCSGGVDGTRTRDPRRDRPVF